MVNQKYARIAFPSRHLHRLISPGLFLLNHNNRVFNNHHSPPCLHQILPLLAPLDPCDCHTVRIVVVVVIVISVTIAQQILCVICGRHNLRLVIATAAVLLQNLLQQILLAGRLLDYRCGNGVRSGRRD